MVELARPVATAAPAVIVNPVKVDDVDELRQQVAEFCSERGCAPAKWYETTEDDPGGGLTRQAIDAGADLVVVAGGDGTVSACAAALAGTDTAMALLPAGTGNLLARNLDIPLDRAGALSVAFGGNRRHLDVIETDNERRFVIMAGLGFDAAMIRDTDPRAKARFGWVAYVGGIARGLRGSPRARFTIRIDDGPAQHHRGIGVIAGNVGQLQGGLAMLPDAEPADGIVDLVILAPQSWRDWPVIVGRLLRGRTDAGGQSAVVRGRRIEISVDRPLPLEFDGDLAGAATTLNLRVRPGALTVCAPA